MAKSSKKEGDDKEKKTKSHRKLEKKEKKKRRRSEEEEKEVVEEEEEETAEVERKTKKNKSNSHVTKLLGLTTTTTPSKTTSKNQTKDESLSNSPFYTKKIHFLVSLLPSSLSNVVSNVSKSIQKSLLLRYSDGMDGILLAFENVKVERKKGGSAAAGRILNEMPHIHFHVVMDALVFCPKVGMKLTGTVNESFPSHVGLLIHSFFNAIVSADQLHEAGFTFDHDDQEWITEQQSRSGDDNHKLSIEDQVSFTVDKLHECAGIISMEGSKPSIVC